MYIGLAKQKDSSSIVWLLNEVTLKLLSKDIRQWDYPWDSSVIDSEISDRHQYIVKEDNRITAVFSLKVMPINYWTGEENADQMYLFRIAVDPQFQGKSIGRVICKWVQSYAIQNNKTIYLDCWAGNEKLKNFYPAEGFCYVGDYPEEDYYVSVYKSQRV